MMHAVSDPWRLCSRLVCRLAPLIGLALPICAAAQTEWQFRDVERVVAIGDIHGAYDAFERILRRTGLIDEETAWTGSRTHLVIVGDVVDRGADSRRALDLIRKLEPEAVAAGGRVHLVLGNHEIMNMTGDLRYVSVGEYAAFADDETIAQRDAAFERLQDISETGEAAADARAAFDAAYPPGYFAHREAFSAGGEYSSWLLGKPTVVVIDDTAFVHGGLAGRIDGSLNETMTQELNSLLAAVELLLSAGLLSETMDLYQLPERADEILAAAAAGETTLTTSEEEAARRLLELGSLTFLAPDGPVWYRGNVGCNRLTEGARLGEAVASIGASRLVVGHTPTRDGLVLSRMSESLLRIDTGMLTDYYGGRASALVIENGALSVFYEDETAPSQPVVQPRRVGFRPGGVTIDRIERVLATGRVVSRQSFDATAALISLADDALELEALFTAAPRDGVNVPVAAYRLDRLLGLDMVPVTVAREIDGVSGALQYWPDNAIGERERSDQQLGASAWCPLADQFGDMYVFDSLIFNERRTPERIRYDVENFQLLLLGHDQTFSTDRGRPEYLSAQPIALTPVWRDALGALDEETLTRELGDVLDRRRIRALLARRDGLLEIAD